MNTLTVGALFAGYGGLEMALAAAFGARVAWHSEIDRAASTVLSARFPGAPNHGDITKIDWRAVEPVDIICGGSPCQDMSHAGKRGGMKDGTRSGLWSYMRDAIEIIRPRLVVWENVRGATSSEADSDVEPCPWCVGDEPEATMRALGRVLADLADLGFDARWYGLRAADVGAPHGRFRIFLFATPADSASNGRHEWRPEPARLLWRHDAAERGAAASDAGGCDQWQHAGEPSFAQAGAQEGNEPRSAGEWRAAPRLTPTTQDGANLGGPSQFRRDTLPLNAAVLMLPTPREPRGASATETRDLLPTPSASDGAGGKVTRGGDRSGEALLGGIDRLLPTPRTENNENRQSEGYGGERGNFHGIIQNSLWGDYAPAIARWERVLGRAAPEPTEPGAKGQPRLSPAFVEWMMGLPAGHVTDPALGVKRNDQLKMLGNGVVPQQAIVAALAFVEDEANP